MDAATFAPLMTQFLFSEAGSQFRYQFRFAEEIRCGGQQMPEIQVTITSIISTIRVLSVICSSAFILRSSLLIPLLTPLSEKVLCVASDSPFTHSLHCPSVQSSTLNQCSSSTIGKTFVIIRRLSLRNEATFWLIDTLSLFIDVDDDLPTPILYNVIGADRGHARGQRRHRVGQSLKRLRLLQELRRLGNGRGEQRKKSFFPTFRVEKANETLISSSMLLQYLLPCHN